MSNIRTSNKRGLRIEFCGATDKRSSQELKRESAYYFFAYYLINNSELNFRKIYQDHKYAV